VVGHAPERVTTDGQNSYLRAIRETLGSDVLHRTNPYLNNRLEQDHRGIKQRHYPMRGFGSFTSASHFCRAFDEVRQFFRVRSAMKQKISLAEQREMFRQGLDALPGHGCDGLTHTSMRGEPSRAHLVGSCILSSDTSVCIPNRATLRLILSIYSRRNISEFSLTIACGL
jgi:DDE superfamily endonuclease